MAKPKQPTDRRAQEPPVQAPAAREPTAKAPAGSAPAAKGSSAQSPAGKVTTGTGGAGQGAAGKRPTAKAPAAKGPAGKAAPANGPAGKRASGQAPGRTRPAAKATAVRAPAVRAAAEPTPPPPWSVRTAVKLMYAGAALSALDLIVTLATAGKAKSLLHAARPGLSPARLTSTVHAEIAYSVVTWLITIALWFVMARTNLAGRAWARIFSTVLAVVSTLSFAGYISQPSSGLSKVILVPLWLAGVAAIVLLWRTETSVYVRAMNPERAQRADDRAAARAGARAGRRSR